MKNIPKIAWWLDSGSTVTAEYTAILARATALGYTAPSAAQQVKQNTLIASLKSAGIWTLMDVFYVFATDGDRNFAKINWKSPSTFLCTESNTPTFTSNVGFTGNASNMKLDTGFNLRSSGVNFVQNEAGMYGYFSGTFDGMLSGTFVTSATTFRASTGTYYINDTTANSVTGGYSNGLWHLKRISGTKAIFKNGVSVVSNSVASVLPDNTTATVLQANGSQYSNVACGFFGIGGSLDTKESSLYTAWNTYLTSL